MPNNELQIARQRVNVRWYHHPIDFANVLKAFIGSNYLGLPFAFFNSGLGLGIIGLIIIACLTDHCCQLIVKCKKRVIINIMQKYQDTHSDADFNTLVRLQIRLEKHLDYADIGNIVLGKWGPILVNSFLLLTQFGFCVAYFIFIGNTVQLLFPQKLVNETIPQFQSSITTVHDGSSISRNVMFNVTNSTTTGITQTTTGYTQTTAYPQTTYTADNGTTADFIEQFVSTAPNLEYLVLIPLPLFILFAYLRSIRNMGIVSAVANLSTFVAYFSVLYYLIEGFSIHPTVQWWKWSTFPIFFGQVTTNYEGIGTIIPIEASMDGNRHNYPRFLHGSILILGVMFASFGILGYGKYGDGVGQIITANLPQGTVVMVAVQIFLMIGVLCTFPLQFFPIAEILEGYIFAEGKCCGPRRNAIIRAVKEEERVSLLEASDESLDELVPVAIAIPESVSWCKRYTFRTFVVLAAAGCAVLLRNFFSYVLSFVGAAGSAALAYILPCFFHIRLGKGTISWPIFIKDVLIIAFGVLGGVVGIVVTIQKIIEEVIEEQ